MPSPPAGHAVPACTWSTSTSPSLRVLARDLLRGGAPAPGSLNAERVGELHPRHVELEALGEARVGRVALRERRDGRQEVRHEDGARELLLDRAIEDLGRQAPVAAADGRARDGDAELACAPLDGFFVEDVAAVGAREEIGVALAPEGRAEVRCAELDRRLAVSRAQVLVSSSVSSIMWQVRAPGRLQHRELGVVARRDVSRSGSCARPRTRARARRRSGASGTARARCAGRSPRRARCGA